MKHKCVAAVPAVAVASICLAIVPGLASDHLDSPRTVADPQSDIADVFAFTSPERPGHLVVAMTVTPFASPLSMFSTRVDYIFRVRRVVATQPLTLDDAPLDIVCDFDEPDGAPPRVTCQGPGGTSTSNVGETTASASIGSMRVFAGRRADPAFFDRRGALSTAALGRSNFTGQNAFAGADVLAIVVEVDSGSLGDAGGSPPMVAVAAETVRKEDR